MSLNLYLDEAKLKKRSGFEAIVKKSKSSDDECTVHYLDGQHVSFSDGRWTLIASSGLEVVPDSLKDLVIGVSLYDDFPQAPRRERGVYLHLTARTELELSNLGGKELKHRVHIEASDLSHARELLRQIKVGSIRPDDSYDGEQNGMSRAQLDKALEEAHSSVERISRRMEQLREDLAEARGQNQVLQIDRDTLQSIVDKQQRSLKSRAVAWLVIVPAQLKGCTTKAISCLKNWPATIIDRLRSWHR